MDNNELIRKYLTVALENMPSRESDRFCVGDTDTIEKGTELTVTFTVGKLWVVRLARFYADAVVGLAYQWMINGLPYPMSEGGFYKGKVISSDIQLIITNATGADEDVAYRIEGWGDLVGGE